MLFKISLLISIVKQIKNIALDYEKISYYFFNIFKKYFFSSILKFSINN